MSPPILRPTLSTSELAPIKKWKGSEELEHTNIEIASLKALLVDDIVKLLVDLKMASDKV